MPTLQEKWNRKYWQYCKVKQELDALSADLDLADAVENLITNDVVTFNWGRGEGRKSVTGTVLGMKGEGSARRVRVFIGAGVSADIKTIRPRDITAVHNADQREVQDEY